MSGRILVDEKGEFSWTKWVNFDDKFFWILVGTTWVNFCRHFFNKLLWTFLRNYCGPFFWIFGKFLWWILVDKARFLSIKPKWMWFSFDLSVLNHGIIVSLVFKSLPGKVKLFWHFLIVRETIIQIFFVYKIWSFL